MTIHLRQVALVAEQLEPVINELTDVLGVQRCYVDQGVGIWGLENTLMPIGTDFLEVVAPIEAGTAAGRYLQRRHGDGGYMVIAQADSAQTQAQCKARAAAIGVRIAFERDRDDYHLMQLHPGDMRASFLEIDSDPIGDFSGYWHPAGGTGWEHAVDRSRIESMTGVQLQAADPDALATHWSRIIGTSVTEFEGHPAVLLANATLTFLPIQDGRGPGLGGVYLSVNDRNAVLRTASQYGATVNDELVQLCGTRFYLRDSHTTD